MPFVVGAPRSGTTLLRFMLESHPLLAIPPETGFLPMVAGLEQVGRTGPDDLLQVLTGTPANAPNWSDFHLDAEELRAELAAIPQFTLTKGVRAFYRLYARKHNKPRYGDKTPLYCEYLDVIAPLVPEAHFIHIIRDGRDQALSIRKTWFAPGPDVESLALYWRRLVRTCRESGRNVAAYLEVRYEDLIREPRPVLERICRFIKLDFHPEMLRYHLRASGRLKEHGSRLTADGAVIVTHEQRVAQQRLTMAPPQTGRIFNWRTGMSVEQQSEFWTHAGDLLQELGYDAR